MFKIKSKENNFEENCFFFEIKFDENKMNNVKQMKIRNKMKGKSGNRARKTKIRNVLINGDWGQ